MIATATATGALLAPAFNALFTWATLTRIFRRYHEPHTTAASLRRGARAR